MRKENMRAGGDGARAHHRPLGVFREDPVVRDVSNEVLAHEVCGGSSAVAVEDAVERQGIGRTPRHLQPLNPAAGVLHGSPATHLAVLSAAQRRLRGLIRCNRRERNVDDAVSRRGTPAGRGDKGARGFQNAFAPRRHAGGGGVTNCPGSRARERDGTRRFDAHLRGSGIVVRRIHRQVRDLAHVHGVGTARGLRERWHFSGKSVLSRQQRPSPRKKFAVGLFSSRRAYLPARVGVRGERCSRRVRKRVWSRAPFVGLSPFEARGKK